MLTHWSVITLAPETNLKETEMYRIYIAKACTGHKHNDIMIEETSTSQNDDAS